jgi:Protein of unknown function (DUF2637)
MTDADTQRARSTWWHLARGRGARLGVVALWILGAVLSYAALRDLALMVGFPELLADLFPLVIDVAAWTASMNALEAAEQRRLTVEWYAWVLVAVYAAATVAGNALVAGTQAVDPRLLHALGDQGAHLVSEVAHAAPAVTMLVFAHLAGLLLAGRPQSDGSMDPRHRLVRVEAELPAAHVESTPATGAELEPAASPTTARMSADRGHDHVLPAWPPVNGWPHGPDGGQTVAARTVEPGPSDGWGLGGAMTAAEAKQAAVRLVRRARAGGRDVTTEDVQRTTSRSARQARRLLAVAMAEVAATSPGDERE